MQPALRRFCAAASAATLALGTLAFAAGTSLAQQPPPPQGQGLDLHAALHIRPDQEAAWRAYQAALAPPQALINFYRVNRPKLAGLTTPARLDIIDQGARMQADAQMHVSAAVRRFYAALSPSQQRIYDQVTTPGANGGGAPPR